MDTGIAGDLPDFGRSGQSRVIASVVTNPCAKDATDHVGHGTHIAGLIAGNSLNHPGLKKLTGRYMGIAPKANLISVKVSDDDGDTTVLDVIYGLQFVVDNKDALGIRVVNLSLTSSVAESYRTDPLDAAVEAAWFAGHRGRRRLRQRRHRRRRRVVRTGQRPVRDHHGGAWTTADTYLARRRRSPPGRAAASPRTASPSRRSSLRATAWWRRSRRGSDFEDLCRKCMIGRTYFRLSGTSMATAVVSGSVALMLEKRPS